MSSIKNLLDTLHRAHCDNAEHAHYATRLRGPGRHSTMPATSFVYEFFLYNSLYQYDWKSSVEEGILRFWPRDEFSESKQQ